MHYTSEDVGILCKYSRLQSAKSALPINAIITVSTEVALAPFLCTLIAYTPTELGRLCITLLALYNVQMKI